MGASTYAFAPPPFAVMNAPLLRTTRPRVEIWIAPPPPPGARYIPSHAKFA